MSTWHTVAKIQDIPAGAGRTFCVDGKLIAVFQIDDAIYAISDLCPHMGASLGEGDVEDGAVTCPWHAWRFCVKDGSWLDSPKSPLKAETYAVRVEADDILVEIPTDRDADGQPHDSADGPSADEASPDETSRGGAPHGD